MKERAVGDRKIDELSEIHMGLYNFFSPCIIVVVVMFSVNMLNNSIYLYLSGALIKLFFSKFQESTHITHGPTTYTWINKFPFLKKNCNKGLGTAVFPFFFYTWTRKTTTMLTTYSWRSYNKICLISRDAFLTSGQENVFIKV